jgi:hypothetical protein
MKKMKINMRNYLGLSRPWRFRRSKGKRLYYGSPEFSRETRKGLFAGKGVNSGFEGVFDASERRQEEGVVPALSLCSCVEGMSREVRRG